jgi:hypothetical protein
MYDKGKGEWSYQKKQPFGKKQQIILGLDDDKPRSSIVRHGAGSAMDT